MAIARMTKIMIVSHRSEAAELLEALQQEGIVEVLDAERAMVSKEWPELQVEIKRPRDIEEMVGRLAKCIAFLKEYATGPAATSIFRPLIAVDKSKYTEVVSGKDALEILAQADKCSGRIEKLKTDSENEHGRGQWLLPWRDMDTDVAELGRFSKASCFAGLVPDQYFKEVCERLTEFGAAIEQVGASGNMHACVVACLSESASDVQKVLRSCDFEAASFEGMEGTAKELIAQSREKLHQMQEQLAEAEEKAGELAAGQLKVQILYDHYQNLLNRRQTQAMAPATENVVLLEGWVKAKEYDRLEKVVGEFSASSVGTIEPGEGEEPPVEIENNRAVRPFEVVTRLYGMPQPVDVDPTMFLAPFFALFFGLCLTDAGYGLVMIAAFAYFMKKMQGDKKLLGMLITCSVLTVIAGALTGSWFGNAIQEFLPFLEPIRVWILNFGFDPLEKPMTFFALSLAVGYLQIMVGLIIAFVHNLLRKDYVAAVCDQLTWLVMLNSIVLFGCGKFGVVSPAVGGIFGKLALVPAIAIVLFSERQGGIGGRLGMGAYQLFSTIFFLGDVLSYLRLMALGMVTAGLGMAVNVIAKIAADIPWIGWLVGALIFVGGHLFNLAISGLSAFVHTLRLQYVEFFPKFLAGGGKLFEPLAKEYKHISLEK